MELLDLLQELSLLKQELAVLRQENADLKERLLKYENPKNSKNSSIPPSKDGNYAKPNQSLRRSSGKKPGGQLGHKGKTLDMTATPDQIIELHPHYCGECGSSLASTVSEKEQVRQVVDIPPIKAVFTEYKSFSKQRSCGCKNSGEFPKNITIPISYGSNIEALVGYFHARQYLPFARMKETFNDVFNIPISEGGIHCLLNRFAKKTTPVYELIKQRVSKDLVIGAEGVKVDGQKHWIWTWQTASATYIRIQILEEVVL